ncbi:MAG TPA: peptide-methionine (R)-S-oxide reductase MsrB [Xanthomonadales bacterium]|nr:peptide-methionine (R)-S-oxide reductase MsrB [Xanthomonadales bacterium]
MSDMNDKPEEYWKEKLTPEQYHVLREKGTEPRFGKYFKNDENGVYECAACGHVLFSSNAKFELDESDPNYGWPSFDDVVNRENVDLGEDNSFLMNRTEVRCKNCGAHLGHLFDDGPKETTGKHYCVNSCALEFKKKE